MLTYWLVCCASPTVDASACRVYVNGGLVGDKLSNLRSVLGVTLERHLRTGGNVIAVVAAQAVGRREAGFWGRLTIGLESAAGD